jgi:transcriptional regulator with XRE-family HTH domain
LYLIPQNQIIFIINFDMETVRHRLKLLRERLGFNQEQLARQLGVGKAALSMIETGRAGLSARNRYILVQELNVNPEWLDHGEGEMFNAEPEVTARLHRTDNSLPLQSVPLYSIKDTAELMPLAGNGSLTSSTNYIYIPNLPKCDGAIYVVGDSMAPLLKSGDIVLYKLFKEVDDIFWGDMYLLSIDLDGDEYVTVKYIQKSERAGYVKLVSQSQHHADKEIPIERIRALALVKASIRMNSIR